MPDTSRALAGFTESTFTHDGYSRQVFAAGTGPAVIVIHEAPGITPEVAPSRGASSTAAIRTALNTCVFTRRRQGVTW